MGPWWVSLILATITILPHFVVLVGAAAIILTSFAVAGSAAVLMLGGLMFGFLAIGAIVTALGIAGMGGAGADDALVKATSTLDRAKQRAFDASQALKDFNALHTGSLTLSQQQQKEDLTVRAGRATENLTQAQIAYNAALDAAMSPVSAFVEHLDRMVHTLEQQAIPLAALIVTWADGYIPAVTQAGQTLMTWFGERLPGVLQAISKVIKDLGPDFQHFVGFLGHMFDHFSPQMGPMFEKAIRLLLGAVEGLLTNLGALTDWFISKLPTYGPIVQSIFGWLGSAVQGVAHTWGKWADWLVDHWPQIVDLATRAVKGLAEGWDKIAPQFKEAAERYLPLLWQALGFVADNSGALTIIVSGLLIIFLAMATAVLAIVGAIEWLILRLQDLGTAVANSPIGLLIGFTNSGLAGAGGFLTGLPGSGLGSLFIPGQNKHAPPSKLHIHISVKPSNTLTKVVAV